MNSYVKDIHVERIFRSGACNVHVVCRMMNNVVLLQGCGPRNTDGRRSCQAQSMQEHMALHLSIHLSLHLLSTIRFEE